MQWFWLQFVINWCQSHVTCVRKDMHPFWIIEKWCRYILVHCNPIDLAAILKNCITWKKQLLGNNFFPVLFFFIFYFFKICGNHISPNFWEEMHAQGACCTCFLSKYPNIWTSKLLPLVPNLEFGKFLSKVRNKVDL